MSSDQPLHGRNLLWFLRHFAWVALACVLLGGAAPLLVAPSQATYEATSLVTAREIAENERVLPALGSAVFDNGAVAAAVAADPAVGGDPDDVVPGTVSVVTGPNSRTMVVQARDRDPGTAARLADIAANTFVAELNRGGAGVGDFIVQAPAVVPSSPVHQVSDLVRAGLGALAGLVFGLGVIAIIASLRRPCVTSRDVEAAVGVPLLGTVELHRARPGTYLGPRGVRGIATVTRWLATTESDRLTLISAPSAAGIRHRIYVMIAIALSTLRPLRLEAAGEIVDVVRGQAPHGRIAPSAREAGDVPTGELVLQDGGSPFELVDPAAATMSVVAVAPVGISRQHLRAVALDYLNGGLVGVVLVERRLGLRRAGLPVRPPSPAPAGLRTVEDVPEPA